MEAVIIYKKRKGLKSQPLKPKTLEIYRIKKEGVYVKMFIFILSSVATNFC